jgi:hypothetical protein
VFKVTLMLNSETGIFNSMHSFLMTAWDRITAYTAPTHSPLRLAFPMMLTASGCAAS